MLPLADTATFNIVQRMDPDILGAMGILVVIGGFILAVVLVVTISTTIQNISLSRMHVKMINDMLAKGYSVDEIDKLVNGHRKSILSRFFDGRTQEYVGTRPVPPVKPRA